MSGLLKNEGVRQMEVRTLGRGSGRGQDVTIILIPKGGRIMDQKLALIHLDLHVLSTHSNYFNRCLGERSWGERDSPSEPIEFYLEVQRDVQHYFDCFSSMYPPFGKSFGSVEHGLELLKVDSQIDFQGLMGRMIALYLSSMLWTEEEEIKVREYAASPNFPRIHLKDLVARLGLDESEEDRQKQLLVLLNGVLEASSIPTLLASPEAFRCSPPSGYSRNVVAILSQAAMEE